MIQRIQSLLLLLASASLGGTFALPYADSAEPIPGTLFADGYFSNADSTWLMGLLGLAAVASAVAIFLYGNRKLQKNVTWVSALLTIAGIGFAVGFFMKQGEAMGTVAVDGEPGAVLPIAGAVLNILAARYINKDEKLVRSADRLR